MPGDHKINITVVVNTEDVIIDANANETVKAVAQQGLSKSESRDKKLADFEVKDGTGKLLNVDDKIGAVAVTKIFLTLPVGVTG